MARYPYREIIELKSTGIATAKVAHLCGTGAGKVRDVVKEAQRLGIGWPVPAELGDDELEMLVDPIERFRKFQPDFKGIALKLGVRKLKYKHLEAAYAAYLEEAEEAGGDPYTFSTFKLHFGKWNITTHPGITMRINWHAGEEAQIDWASRTLTIVSADNVRAPAFLFVATLPFSDLTFVRASLDMAMQSWLEHHVRMFAYFDGVPIFSAIDNLATGVSFGDGGIRSINAHYQDLADHYGTIVVPARVRTATDKAAVEGHVKIMANAIVGILEGMRFTSINQLNESISALLEVFNARPSSVLHGLSRREAFEAWERDALQPLPEEPYSSVTWRKYTVNVGDVVRVRGNYYALPKGFGRQTVWARVSQTRIDVYDSHKVQCLASYPRREDGGETLSGLPGTSPDRYRPLDDWARANGRELLLAQWDWERNGSLLPSKIVCRSKKRVWWRCPECGYPWQEAPIRRMKRSFDDCPACAGIALIPGENDLATTHPEIAAEWHPEFNPLRADQVFADWGQRMWWIGACGHTWCAPISERTGSAKGALCPYCSGRAVLPGFNDVGTLAPELAAVWHPTKNAPLAPEGLSVCAAHAVYLWRGPLTRIWRETPRAWLTRHGKADVLEPFDEVVAVAKAYDVEHPAEPSHTKLLGKAKATLKWAMFKTQSDLRISLSEWCERTHHPELIEQWDDERNAPLTPDAVSYCHRYQVWWHDPACGHSWRETVRRRTYNDLGCIHCSRARVLAGHSSLERLSTELLKLWHPTKNAPLTPDGVSDRSHEPIWWKCPDCGYEWAEPPRKTNVASRKCPVCANRPKYLTGDNDLAAKHPRLAAMLVGGPVNRSANADAGDPASCIEVVTSDGEAAQVREADPGSILPQSKKYYLWRGPCGHTWKARVDAMVRLGPERACPYCDKRKLLSGFNDLAAVCPEAASMWHPTRNGSRKPDKIRANSSEGCWWLGPCGHEWEQGVGHMVRYPVCPYCKGYKVLAGVNDLATLRPDLAATWHPTKNGDLAPEDVRVSSNRRVWWQCEHGHEWQAVVGNRAKKDAGCPVCDRRIAVVGVNDLKTTHRKLARQWHPDKNGGLTARGVTSRCGKKVWWRCENGHDAAVTAKHLWMMVTQLFEISIDQGCSLMLRINLVVLLVFVVAAAALCFLRFCGAFRRPVTVKEASLGIGSSSVTLKFGQIDRDIAYKLWVEMSTRKIGLLVDKRFDTIIEVYDSWYRFFMVARELMKETPLSRRGGPEEVAKLTERVLNDGLRPHLTRWQAEFRHWYEVERIKDENAGLSPQEIQRMFPEYDALMLDLLETSERMVYFKDLMYELAFS